MDPVVEFFTLFGEISSGSLLDSWSRSIVEFTSRVSSFGFIVSTWVAEKSKQLLIIGLLVAGVVGSDCDKPSSWASSEVRFTTEVETLVITDS